MLELLRRIDIASNKHTEADTVKNISDDSEEITKEPGGDGTDGKENQPPKVEEVIRKAEYYPDRNDLLHAGDCEKTIEFLKNNPAVVNQGVTHRSHTVLHIAIFDKRRMKLIEEIVKLMSPEFLEYRAGVYNYTSLHYAAQDGNFEAVVLLITKNRRLPLLRDKRGFTPLDIALQNVSIYQTEVVEYLFSVTKDVVEGNPFSGVEGASTLCELIQAYFYDIALCLVMKFPTLATTKSNRFVIQVDMKTTCIQSVEPAECTIRDEENPAPENLDSSKIEERSKVTSSTTYRGLVIHYLTRAIGIEHLYKQKLVHQQANALIKQIIVDICKSTTLLNFLRNNPNIMKKAIKHGIIEFVAECLEKNNNLIFYKIPVENMLQMAITERKEMIATFICKTADRLGDKNYLVSKRDADNNTILHCAAKLAPLAQLSLVSGAALQMQREMQWFKGIKGILRESDRYTRNENEDTAKFMFTEAHKELVEEGRDWLKDTSGSCMIVGALIATVAFAAAFTVPGGNISDSNNAMNRTPIFLGQSSFTVFAVSDALALFSSITSVLMFLAIYTSRFAEGDFLKSLPQKLIFGLATLFISMVAILVAFGASLLIVVGSRFAQAIIPITLFGCCPLALFAWLQLPLFVEMVRTTYWGGIFKKHAFVDISSQNKSRKTKKKN
ncbi:protein ACCELERATED CELL DEATH 6-like isoform X4 [Papaver somniferum]|uniref:protein ACCELERATED CELL DEATH 6-like isoform X4 n=1 Tax=Papaver somniferum TaxID=3469 RepID=UPI000E6FFE82|nr:protein ACCELERATED CELL DEATH 6-like isoform X4 [Papaver somniferum]